MTDTPRLFFALWPSPATAADLTAWAEDAHALCGGRVMRPDTLHLTLAFLGHTEPERAMHLARHAQHWEVAYGPITLCRFGRFTGPQVVWAGPQPDGDEAVWLTELHHELWARVQDLGWERPEGGFRPHVSLLRKAGPGDLSALRRPPLTWTPQACVLVASTPREGASHYQVLATLRQRETAASV